MKHSLWHFFLSLCSLSVCILNMMDGENNAKRNNNNNATCSIFRRGISTRVLSFLLCSNERKRKMKATKKIALALVFKMLY